MAGPFRPSLTNGADAESLLQVCSREEEMGRNELAHFVPTLDGGEASRHRH
jgi:hypothetical protein